jgi:hypothetical protein
MFFATISLGACCRTLRCIKVVTTKKRNAFLCVCINASFESLCFYGHERHANAVRRTVRCMCDDRLRTMCHRRSISSSGCANRFASRSRIYLCVDDSAHIPSTLFRNSRCFDIVIDDKRTNCSRSAGEASELFATSTFSSVVIDDVDNESESDDNEMSRFFVRIELQSFSLNQSMHYCDS